MEWGSILGKSLSRGNLANETSSNSLSPENIFLSKDSSKLNPEDYESLVDELIKEVPDTKLVKRLCKKLGIHYLNSQHHQICELLVRGSSLYLKRP